LFPSIKPCNHFPYYLHYLTTHASQSFLTEYCSSLSTKMVSLDIFHHLSLIFLFK
jgi:hypothetical protein